MEKLQEIKVGKGLNNVLFGISRETLKGQLGEPTEIDNYNAGDDDEYLTEAWHYDDYEISASFDEEDDWRLTTLSTSSPIATFEGKKIIGMSMKEIQDLIAPLGLGDSEIEDMEEDQILLSYVDSSLNFWFEDDQLSEVQWGVLWKDEDTPNWPL